MWVEMGLLIPLEPNHLEHAKWSLQVCSLEHQTVP